MPAGEPHGRKSLPAGINPIYGLYTAAFATAIGALLTGSSFLKMMLSNVLVVSLDFGPRPGPGGRRPGHPLCPDVPCRALPARVRAHPGLGETGATAAVGPGNIFVATPVIGESLMEAIRTGEAGA
jgi:hypothetical protein